jgi:transcriptional regulator with XRE-family HTH domain
MPRKKKRSKQPSQVPPLDERHYRAIEMLTGLYENGCWHWFTRQEIAEACGVSRMQLWRWEQRKDFQRELEKRRKAKLRAVFPRREELVEMALAGDAEAALEILRACDILV